MGPSLALFALIAVCAPWFLSAVFNADGVRTSPGLRALLAVATVGALVGSVFLGRAQAPLWRAARRRPWWLLRWRPGAPSSCPYCRDELGSSQPMACPECAASYHGECWDELGGCATLGCGHSARRDADRALVGSSKKA